MARVSVALVFVFGACGFFLWAVFDHVIFAATPEACFLVCSSGLLPSSRVVSGELTDLALIFGNETLQDFCVLVFLASFGWFALVVLCQIPVEIVHAGDDLHCVSSEAAINDQCTNSLRKGTEGFLSSCCEGLCHQKQQVIGFVS